MSLTRSLCVVFASVTLVGALWVPSEQLATPGSNSPTPVASAAMLDDGQASGAGEVPPFKPVARISSLMTGIGSAFGKVRDVFPQTDDENRLGKITANAEVIAELSNVHTRHRRKPAYLEMAANTGAIALELAREARADTPNEAQLGMLITQLDNSCATCHESEN